MAQTPQPSAAGATITNAENDVKEDLSTGKKPISINSASQTDRILRKGDLVRILDSTPTKPKLKNHIGNLGRIVRSIPVEDPDALHPFLYDIDFILGGKVAGVERCDLQYTTAEAEGMIGNTKRKRKKNTSFVPTPDMDKPNNKKPTPPKKKTGAAKKTAGGKKRGPSGNVAKGKAKKSKTSKVDRVEYAAPSTNLSLYERHRREFERCVGRLEKADTFHWFMGEVPSEYDEPDTTESDSVDKPGNAPQRTNEEPLLPGVKGKQESSTTSGHDDLRTLPTPTETLSAPYPDPPTASSKIIETAKKKKFEIRSPNNPPYNFDILRKRIARGRYVLDEEALENKHHRAMIKPYSKSLGNTTKEDRAKRSKARAKLDILHPKAVDWDLFRADVLGMCDNAVKRDMECDDGSSGTISYACRKIKEVMEQIYERTGKRQLNEIRAANTRHRYASAIESFSNNEAAVQGKWRKEAFPYRRYERLKTDVVCAGLSQLDERIAIYELKTSLKDSFVGLSYLFDDTEKSEGWMKSMLNESGDRKQQRRIASALQSDNGVIKAQVEATMQSLLIAVQDRVMTDLKVLEQPELRNASWMTNAEEAPNEILSGSTCNGDKAPEIVEQPVWGIDCYTRRNVSICLETAIDADTASIFVEKWLLPAINACPVEIAHNIANAARILEGLPFESDPSAEQKSISMEHWRETLLGKALLNKIAQSGPPWLKYAAQVLRKACESLGSDFFRVHPKGHGSIVLCPKLEANKLVTFYRGEVYPSWRWGEKMDAIATIQEKKGLKPVLPDFFNMALERPMKDPRGYGLLFCDASRKSGYGSMLSHSCEPSCEVRVAAVNGELTLAMTTLREMTIGDELTFDYNAVTESLNEYRSAVCLCGHGRCRGSFLHFATADCYQQVLNRNSPIAVRLSNLIKGCMKKVMSEDDQEVLKRHGFQTAAFGAVSVNRRSANRNTTEDLQLDSMTFVPIWLQTYVADTLRYIEYERRALPIALICNQLNADEKGGGGSRQSEEKDESGSDEDDDRPVKGAKPEPAFFFYSRTRKSHFVSLLMKDSEHQNLTGLELKREVQKLASSHWKSLSADEKSSWKKKSRQEWLKNGGMEKARLEQARLARVSKGKSKTKDKKGGNKEKTKAERTKGGGKKVLKNDEEKPPESKMTFQLADAEGISAMEQRIQQLTQTLSRVGRVLDRHREAIIQQENDQLLYSDDSESGAAAIRQLVHSPLAIMPDQHIVAWVWNHDDGIVKVLLKCIADETCVSPKLRNRVMDTAAKHSALEKFGCPWRPEFKPSEEAMSPAEGRKYLNEALMELRSNILDGIDEMAADIKRHRSSSRKEAARKKKIEDERKEVRAVMSDLIKGVEIRLTGMSESNGQITEGDVEMNESEDAASEEWMQNFNKRFKLEKAADILLMYACTSTFFALKSYQPLQSSPVEVYARELGNEVPTSAIDTPRRDGGGSLHANASPEKMVVDNSTNSKKAKCVLCEPDDIIAEVAVEYQGDYVVSQLLQWYNAGIDQKPGLPDLLGCVMLPTMEGIWSIDGTQGSSSRTDRATGYKLIVRPRLVDWLKDPLKRGSPWPDDLRRAFIEKANDKPISDASNLWKPIGSPILDFLVTGEDCNINSILQEMGGRNTNKAVMDSSGMLSSVDHGRPALAVSNWVQCENPDCLKWRKLPWHVDIDTLAETFYCKDNIWNPQSASCDAPEDQWDERTDGLVDADGSAPIALPEEEVAEDSSSDEEDSEDHGLEAADFKVGARFDVMHTAKSKWVVGVVVKILDEGLRREVKVHFLNHSVKYDEWIRAPSSRIAPLYSQTQEPPKRKEKKKQQSFSSGQNNSLQTNLVDGQSSETEDPKIDMQGSGVKENEASATSVRPTPVSDESSAIHSPAKEMGDFSIYSSEDDENEPIESKKRRKLKKLISKKSKTQEKAENVLSFSPMEAERKSLEPANTQKGRTNQIPRKKTQPDEPEASALQPLDKETNKQKRKKEKKNVSTFKPLIPRKRPQDKVHSADHESKGGSLIPRKPPAKKEQGLTSLMKSDDQESHQNKDSRLKAANKPLGVNEKRPDPKTTPAGSRKVWNPAGFPHKQHKKTDGESRSRPFHEPRGSTSAHSPRRRAKVDDEDGVILEDPHRAMADDEGVNFEDHLGFDEISRTRLMPPNEDSRGSFDGSRGSRRSFGDKPGTHSSGDIHERYAESHPQRNEPFHDEERSSRSRWRNEENYSREYGRENVRDYDREATREYSRDFEGNHRAPDDMSYGRGGDRERSREYGRDYDRDYGKSPDRRYERDYSRRYDGTEYKYSRDRGYYRDDTDYNGRGDQGYDRDEVRDYRWRGDQGYDRDEGRAYKRQEDQGYDRDKGREYRGRGDQVYDREEDRDYRGRKDQGYDRDEGREYVRRYDDDYDRYDDRDYRRRYERDYDRHNERDRRYDQEYARDNDREYRRHYDRPRDDEMGRKIERQSNREYYDRDREYDHGNNRSHSRDRSHAFREEYSGSYERQQSSRGNSGRFDSPSKRRY